MAHAVHRALGRPHRHKPLDRSPAAARHARHPRPRHAAAAANLPVSGGGLVLVWGSARCGRAATVAQSAAAAWCTHLRLPPPPLARSKLYMLLHETAPIVGLWRLVGEGPRGALIAFRRAPGALRWLPVRPAWRSTLGAAALRCCLAAPGSPLRQLGGPLLQALSPRCAPCCLLSQVDAGRHRGRGGGVPQAAVRAHRPRALGPHLPRPRPHHRGVGGAGGRLRRGHRVRPPGPAHPAQPLGRGGRRGGAAALAGGGAWGEGAHGRGGIQG